MTRLTGLILAAACAAAVVGLPTPGEAHGLRHDGRCEWVIQRPWPLDFQHRHRGFGFHSRGFFPGRRHHLLAPRQVRAALRWQGYRSVRAIHYRHGVYRALARGRHGRLHRLFVHPMSGRVMCASRVRRHVARNRFPWWHGWTDWRTGRNRFHP
ncbi:MAG: hypothetical protein ACE5JZ_08190 [Kiloniellales bacterium]